MAKKDEMFMEKVQINYEKINEALKKEGLCARETANLLGYNMWYLYYCKKTGVMPLTAVKQIAELCNVPYETFLAETKTEEPEVVSYDKKINKISDKVIIAATKRWSDEKALELTEKAIQNGGSLSKADISEALGFPVTDQDRQSSRDTVDTDGEDIMILRFSTVEYKRIEELTKHFKLDQTTKLFHKLLNDAWLNYRKEKLKDEVRKLSEEDLLKRYIASVFGTDKYDKEDLVRKIVDDAMRRYPNG